MTETPSVLVDTNVLSDVVSNDPQWAQWSIRQLEAAALRGAVAINEVVYAELSVRFGTIEELDLAIELASIELIAMPRPALFLAGKAYQRYRARGGPRTSILPDFFVGAHAAFLGVPLLTRDTRYGRYFPTLQLIAP